MEAFFIRESSGVRQVVILGNQVRVTPDAVQSARLVSFVLNIPVLDENRKQLNPDTFYLEHPAEQLQSLTKIVCVAMPPPRVLRACSEIAGKGKKVSR